jgi:dTDP-4-amino-4,6-dideoxygalactose transaminase
VKIPITRPCFDEAERQAIVEPLASGWVVQGPKVAEFERRFAAFVGAPHAVATTSCTTALHLALAAAGIGPGDDVIVPSFTWIATANVVEYTGARLIVVDICLDTYNIDPRAVSRALTPRTRAIIPVSLFGVSAPMRDVTALAASRDLTVIEDDACAFGAYYNGSHAGTLAMMGCFSFHPRKAITTGEGGMVITADDAVAARLRSLRDHGASTSDLARHHSPRSYELPAFNLLGFNYRMTDFQGAVGVAQMAKAPRILEERRRVAAGYDSRLERVRWLRRPLTPPDCVHGYQSYVCLFAPEEPTLANVDALHARRNAVMDTLAQAGISTRPGTHAVHTLGYYTSKYGFGPGDFPNSLLADRLTITLPLSPQMTDEEQDYIADVLQKVRP